AEEAEASLAAAFATGGEGDTESAGVVRIAAVPMITAHVLAPSLRLLNELAPGVVVELIAVPETQALTWRDADIALRLARPGGSSFLARRIATIAYAVVARRGTTAQPDRLPWIGFDETVAGEPEARW